MGGGVSGIRGQCALQGRVDGTHLCGQGHASRDEATAARVSRSHHAKLAGRDELGEVLDLLVERHLLVEVGRLVGVGGLVAGRRVGERHGWCVSDCVRSRVEQNSKL